MSAPGFTAPLDVRILDRLRGGRVCAELLTPFEYHVGHLGSGAVIIVPAGFVTDFASAPRWTWTFVPPLGRYAKAAVLHDWLCEQKDLPRPIVDAIFNEAMGVARVPAWLRVSIYTAVRLFGRDWNTGRARSVGEADAPSLSAQQKEG